MKMKVIVVWIIVIMPFVESFQSADECANLDIHWKEDNENEAQKEFIDEYSWLSWGFNIIAFKWTDTSKINEKLNRNICACVLYRTLTENSFTWTDLEAFYNDMKSKLEMAKKSVKILMGKKSSKSFSATECSFDGLKRTFVQGYGKKSLVAPIYNIYIAIAQETNENEYTTFDAYLKKANPDKL